MEQEILFEAKGITKFFPGVRALSDVDMVLHKGEVLAIIGENGAGKSTLMNIMLGSIQPTSGEMFFEGKPFQPKNPTDALVRGVSMIHQELTLVPDMTVSENIWLGQEKRFSKAGFLHVKEREKATRAILEEYNISIKPSETVRLLSVAQMQLVELVRAVSWDSKVIIMDEPTSALTDKEIGLLYELIKKISAKGIAVTFITHKLNEVFEICENVMIMRDGQLIDRQATAEISSDEMISKMVGRDLANLYPKVPAEIGEVVMEVKGLTRTGYFKDVNFTLRKGEILGFSGLIGAGRSEVMESIFGITRFDSGEVYLYGKKADIRTPGDAIANKMAMVTEDRLRRGLIHILSLKFNMSLAYLGGITKWGFVNRKQEDIDCERLINSIDVATTGLKQIAGTLSGGNQQKVIIAKWLLTKSEIIIMDEPTRGIDVGSKAEIYKLMGELASQGKAVIMISSELPELLGVTDRMMIMSNGEIVGELDREEYDENTILQYAFGLRRKDA
jgi:ABC-type sugar transport system ATPase subunit